MKQFASRVLLLSSLLLVLLMAGCSNKSNPIAAFQPEVVNNTDAFQFQITEATNVTTTLNYTWSNTGAQATIDHSTALTGGTATLILLDPDDNQVYSSGLLASGNEPTTTGTAGNWTVRIILSNFSGTANFRAEKL